MEEDFLNKIRIILENNFSETNFDITQLCQELGISRPHLHRKLIECGENSASHYIRSFRLQKAKIILETTDLRISEVAYQSGFSNLSYFSTSFLNEFGLPPSEYRKNESL